MCAERVVSAQRARCGRPLPANLPAMLRVTALAIALLGEAAWGAPPRPAPDLELIEYLGALEGDGDDARPWLGPEEMAGVIPAADTAPRGATAPAPDGARAQAKAGPTATSGVAATGATSAATAGANEGQGHAR